MTATPNPEPSISRGAVLALAAAWLGWLFDGFEMGVFSLVARQAVADLLHTNDEAVIGQWFSIATAAFLVGAATGGVLFGWLGDRLGRVRAMMLSILTYALFTGACGLATNVPMIVAFRFIAALGMGGEWALGVALVMELWPNRSRAWLAGFIGGAVNLGFAVVALVSISLTSLLAELHRLFAWLNVPGEWTTFLLGHSAWRLLLLIGTLPALLTVFIRIWVPESPRWEKEQAKGATSHWATRDLLGVLLGSAAACGIIALWATPMPTWARIAGTLVGLLVSLLGLIYPALRYLHRAGLQEGRSPVVRRMLLGAALSGIPLIGTWAATQWIPLWADQLAGPGQPLAKGFTACASALGAVGGTMLAALAGDWLGRRVTYFMLCVAALASQLALFQFNSAFGWPFLAWVFVAGAAVGSFYGLLALYLPELFPTAVRSLGQGFSYNFGRILAAIGTLQTGTLVAALGGSYPQACSIVSLMYLVGLGVIWLAPETRGKGLPG